MVGTGDARRRRVLGECSLEILVTELLSVSVHVKQAERIRLLCSHGLGAGLNAAGMTRGRSDATRPGQFSVISGFAAGA